MYMPVKLKTVARMQAHKGEKLTTLQGGRQETLSEQQPSKLTYGACNAQYV